MRNHPRCTFLTPEGRCELHDKGLKPLEGRVALHYNNDDEADARRQDELSDGVRAYIVRLWREARGRFRFNDAGGIL